MNLPLCENCEAGHHSLPGECDCACCQTAVTDLRYLSAATAPRYAGSYLLSGSVSEMLCLDCAAGHHSLPGLCSCSCCQVPVRAREAAARVIPEYMPEYTPDHTPEYGGAERVAA